MTAMPAITLWQPWATLVALGVKTIETRSWGAPQGLVEQRIAIHAAAKVPASWVRVGDYSVRGFGRTGLALEGPGLVPFRSTPRLQYQPLPLGAVVATARLADCLPMLEPDDPTGNQAHLLVHGRHDPDAMLVCRPGTAAHTTGGVVGSHFEWVTTDVRDQRPLGDFAPGRWAWLLDEVEPMERPVPARGRQRVWYWEPAP